MTDGHSVLQPRAQPFGDPNATPPRFTCPLIWPTEDSSSGKAAMRARAGRDSGAHFIGVVRDAGDTATAITGLDDGVGDTSGALPTVGISGDTAADRWMMY